MHDWLLDVINNAYSAQVTAIKTMSQLQVNSYGKTTKYLANIILVSRVKIK